MFNWFYMAIKTTYILNSKNASLFLNTLSQFILQLLIFQNFVRAFHRKLNKLKNIIKSNVFYFSKILYFKTVIK